MKLTPDLQRAQDRMKPGVISLHGFLGTDPRNLLELLTADQDTVNSLGLTHEQIADRLDALAGQARAGLGSPVLVEGRYELLYEEVKGSIRSPFGSPARFPKDTVRLRDRATGESLQWSSLTVYMIREHGFYEGIGSPYRIDPTRAARLLHLR